MRDFFRSAVLTLAAATAASAEVNYPLGKGLESLDLPFADSFLVSGRVEESYADDEMTGAEAKLLFEQLIPDGNYELDTIRQIVIGFPTGYLVTTDSAGLPSRMTSRFDGMGTSSLATSARRYDAQGRVVMELGTTTVSSSLELPFDPVYADTIRWTWTHPGCADDQESDTLRVWSVDAQGRCASADVRVVSEEGSVATGYTDKILWQGNVLAGALRLQGTDTLLRNVFTVDARGMVTEDVSYEKIDGEWILTSRDSFVYVDGKMDLLKSKEYTDGVVTSDIQFKSTRSRTGVSFAGRPGTRWIAVERDEGVVSFANRSTGSVVVDLLDAQGRRVHALTLGAGSTATWDAAPKGPLFWRARGASVEASGRLSGLR